MVLMALRLVQPNDQRTLDELFRARPRLAAEFPMPRRRLGGIRQGSDAALARRHAVRRSQRDSRSDLQRSDRAHARIARLHRFRSRSSARVRRAVQYLIDTQEDDGSWYGRWGVNYIYGTWQVLRGLARHRRRHDAGLDSARTRLAGELPERRRRLGRNLRDLRRSGAQRQRREHGIANGVGVDGNLRLRRSRSRRACNAVCVSCSARNNADGSWTEPQITGTGFPGVFYLKYDMYRQNFPLLALATYVNYRRGLGHPPSFYRC